MWNTKIDLAGEDGKVVSIEVKRADFELRRIRKTCTHYHVLIDTALAELECRDCGAKLNPVEYLANLVGKWRHVELLYERYQQMKEYVESRSRVKCRHCGHFTNIR
jgi:ribosomal protein S27E